MILNLHLLTEMSCRYRIGTVPVSFRSFSCNRRREAAWSRVSSCKSPPTAFTVVTGRGPADLVYVNRYYCSRNTGTCLVCLSIYQEESLRSKDRVVGKGLIWRNQRWLVVEIEFRVSPKVIRFP